MNLDFGKDVKNVWYGVDANSGAIVLDKGYPEEYKLYKLDKPYFDPEFMFIPDNSFIDGYGAQDIRYFEHRLDEIREWLKVEPIKFWADICIINFRGGEYQNVPELFLPQEYWDNAISMMREKYPGIWFEVHTDDPVLAKKLFPDINIIQNIGTNWRSIRYAKKAIISNSAFAIVPRLLAHLDNEDSTMRPDAITIAPKYWAGHNVNEWRRPGNYYKKFTYI